MSTGPSMLSLVASSLYALVFLGCLVAAIAASRSRQAPGHRWMWLALALFFAGLAALRMLEIEDMVRDAMRQSMRDEGVYSERRSVQRPIVASLVVLVGAGGSLLLYRWGLGLRGRRNVARLAAVLAACAMLFLMALRLISLHAIDVLLYGPLKLNWIVDLGASFLVLGSAIHYTRIVRRTS